MITIRICFPALYQLCRRQNWRILMQNMTRRFNGQGITRKRLPDWKKEKENKKLAVQKKYANVQFAIKVSEIIANTAVAIMQAFAQMGPIAGAIAAAVMTTTGAAQIAVANAERKKVMNMTVDGSGSGGGSGTRVATGSSSSAWHTMSEAGPVMAIRMRWLVRFIRKEYVVPSFRHE